MKKVQFLIIAMASMLFIACGDDDNDNQQQSQSVPVLSTTEVTGVDATNAMSGGNITDSGGTRVTARGVCWSTGETPTILDNKTEEITNSSTFTSGLIGLEPNTTYYLRAYATNTTGTGYGSVKTFTTQERATFTDPRDGKVYQTVVIGNQEWMLENLAYKPSSGTYWAYDNDDANVEIYGYLYDWTTAENVCPTGWHLPSRDELFELILFLDGMSVTGEKLKQGGTTYWRSPNRATNQSGFTALPGGRVYKSPVDGSITFSHISEKGYWWSPSPDDGLLARRGFGLDHNSEQIYLTSANQHWGYSVRCLRD